LVRVAGAVGAAFEGKLPRSGGLQAWVRALEPASVDGGRFNLK
jgi:hypothetical protein